MALAGEARSVTPGSRGTRCERLPASSRPFDSPAAEIAIAWWGEAQDSC